MSRLIIISNRLPFSLDTDADGTPRLRQSSGGLVSALKSYFESTNSTGDSFTERIWVGSGDFSEEMWNSHGATLSSPDFTIEPVFIDNKLYNNYYNGFSNSTIWPLFHYFPSITEYEKEYFDDYFKVNRVFSEKIVSVMRPGDVVWIHDYQLMLLPQMIRKERPQATIGFFLHIPFPSYEIYRLLPKEWKKTILIGLLGADLIGFHTWEYCQYFIQSVKMVLGLENHFNSLQYNNRLLKVDLFPIGIDYDKFEKAATEPPVLEYLNEFKENFGDKKIIFSVDRLDYTKGLTYRLQGFENFLERYSEWREKVVFIFNIVPSRGNIPSYSDRKKMIEEKVSTINGRFSTIQWQPLIYRYNHLKFEELCALYQAADVALITPLRDGMNLVAKEYVASSVNGGVLILSDLTGAASELNEASLVNPTDTEEMADAIAAALNMPENEQKERMQVMQRRLKDYDVLHWVNDFLEQLTTVKNEQEKLKVKLLDARITEKIIGDYRNAKKRCILLDYDGTLTPYTKLPSHAAPGIKLLEVLAKISADENNEVSIISGRDSETLEKWLGHLPLNFVSEHGAYIKYKNQQWQAQTTISPEWKDRVRPMLQSYVSRCAGSLIEEKTNTISWHYRNTHPGLGFIRSRELLNNLLQLTANTPLQVIDGNKVLEVRLIGLDKGMTALKLVNHFQPDFIICIGDDTTDEDMFKALESKGYTVRIGNGATSANFNILTQAEVLPFLENLVNPALLNRPAFV